ncbi:MAG: DMT family transporter [Pseudomonadales bacterium]|nr:DMT family transporter [Pseudomonadales bacterium]
MLGTLCSFCLMAIGARELSSINTFQVLFIRSLIGLLAVTLVIGMTGNLGLFTSKKLIQHGVRNLFHFGGQYGWFLGITLLPLAEVFALEFTVPFWTALIAWLILGEKLTTKKLSAIFLGMAGVLIILKPGVDIVSSASLIVLAAAVCYGAAHSTTKYLTVTENPLTILFMMCTIQLPIALLFSVYNWQTPQLWEWFWLAIIGFTALTAHFCMTKAMQLTEVTVVVTMDFLRLPVIAFLGILLYAETFEMTLIIGGIIMLLGNLLNMPVSKPAVKDHIQ